jgi:hypothetical protein
MCREIQEDPVFWSDAKYLLGFGRKESSTLGFFVVDKGY